ncbi:hypothetical protein [Fulvivirga ligni]|uniref:hypothetical protein n=1 Tax=Fulvivirga ligni TaxID=2904246 RepID=UPI001F1D21A0|nr:hypothetical protein [Fulvivirga ligni]UII19606.1 hypothetical protein LVD16_17340 [Fulvivirga ligni]
MKKTRIFVASALVLGSVLTTLASGVFEPKPAAKPCGYECPMVYDPVCIIATGQKFGNSCLASCAGYTADQWTRCGDQIQ